MEKATEETAVNLMQLMLDEDWVREAVRIEEETGCDMGAGFDLGVITFECRGLVCPLFYRYLTPIREGDFPTSN